MLLKDTYLFNRFIDRRLKTVIIKNVSNSTRAFSKIILVITNVTCNLKCFCCSTFCDLNIGSNSYNKEEYILKPYVLNQFLENISDYKPDYYISLQGGETTILDKEIIKEYVNVIRNNNRKVLCLTNGFNIRRLDPYLFDKIVLDEHMQNRKDVELAVKYFDKVGYKDYSINITRYHYDLRSIMKDNRIINDFKCKDMYDAITLDKEIVYPCCVSPMLQGYENRLDYVNDLKKNGFVYDNKYLGAMLNDIETFLPESFYDVCNNYCYRRRIKTRKVYRATNYNEKIK